MKQYALILGLELRNSQLKWQEIKPFAGWLKERQVLGFDQERVGIRLQFNKVVLAIDCLHICLYFPVQIIAHKTRMSSFCRVSRKEGAR